MKKRKAIEVHLDYDDPSPSFCHCCDGDMSLERIDMFYAAITESGLPVPVLKCCKDDLEIVGWKDYKDDWTQEMWDLLDD